MSSSSPDRGRSSTSTSRTAGSGRRAAAPTRSPATSSARGRMRGPGRWRPSSHGDDDRVAARRPPAPSGERAAEPRPRDPRERRARAPPPGGAAGDRSVVPPSRRPAVPGVLEPARRPGGRRVPDPRQRRLPRAVPRRRAARRLDRPRARLSGAPDPPGQAADRGPAGDLRRVRRRGRDPRGRPCRRAVGARRHAVVHDLPRRGGDRPERPDPERRIAVVAADDRDEPVGRPPRRRLGPGPPGRRLGPRAARPGAAA